MIGAGKRAASDIKTSMKKAEARQAKKQMTANARKIAYNTVYEKERRKELLKAEIRQAKIDAKRSARESVRIAHAPKIKKAKKTEYVTLGRQHQNQYGTGLNF